MNRLRVGKLNKIPGKIQNVPASEVESLKEKEFTKSNHNFFRLDEGSSLNAKDDKNKRYIDNSEEAHGTGHENDVHMNDLIGEFQNKSDRSTARMNNNDFIDKISIESLSESDDKF
jgi:hypothetical protein